MVDSPAAPAPWRFHRRLRMSTMLFCAALPILVRTLWHGAGIGEGSHNEVERRLMVVHTAIQAIALAFTLLWLWQAARTTSLAWLGAGPLLFFAFFFIVSAFFPLMISLDRMGAKAKRGEALLLMAMGLVWLAAGAHYLAWLVWTVQKAEERWLMIVWTAVVPSLMAIAALVAMGLMARMT